jgi:hypothetical protein
VYEMDLFEGPPSRRVAGVERFPLTNTWFEAVCEVGASNHKGLFPWRAVACRLDTQQWREFTGVAETRNMARAHMVTAVTAHLRDCVEVQKNYVRHRALYNKLSEKAGVPLAQEKG